MRRFVLVALISCVSFVAMAINANTTLENDGYSVEKVTMANQEVANFPYSSVTCYKDTIFEFKSESGEPMVITFDEDSAKATIVSNGTVSTVKAELKHGKKGQLTLIYGGYTVVLDKVSK